MGRRIIMQEEVSNQIVIILKNTGRLTAQALKHAIIKAVIDTYKSVDKCIFR